MSVFRFLLFRALILVGKVVSIIRPTKTSPAVAAGQCLPEGTLSGPDGAWTLPERIRGRWTVIYFYPKDESPGCTFEAIGFQKVLPDFRNLGAQILGVSVDTCESHRRFASCYSLEFPLLQDPNGSWAARLGLRHSSGLIVRSTILVDPEGIVAHTWSDNPDPFLHPREVYEKTRAEVQRVASDR